MAKLQGYLTGKRYIKILIDIASVFVGFIVALAVRFEFSIPEPYLANFWLAIPIIIALYIAMNSALRIYSGRWKFVTMASIARKR